jgi:hypothetical protein
MTAADDYKAEVKKITEGIAAEVGGNQARVRELEQRLAELRRELDAAADGRHLVRIAAALAWEDALEALWVESWMTMRPFPRPDRLAKAGPAAELAAQIEQRSAELQAAVRRRGSRRAG